MKQFLSVADLPGSVSDFVEQCQRIKSVPHAFRYKGEGKTLTCLYFNPSLRTRLSTTKAGHNMEMHVVNMDAGGGWKMEMEDGVVMNLDTAEHVKEAARVISQYTDILAIRSFPNFEDREADYQDKIIKAFVQYATVPVMSLESATRHPLQSLADCITIAEQSSRPRPKVVLTWAPHPRRLPQAVANSFAEWMRAWGEVDLVIANPPGMDLAPEFTRDLPVLHNQAEAFAGADFIYAKNWSSYFDYGKRFEGGADWQVTAEKMALTNNGKFMHCLPVRRNVVVSDAVIDSEHSLVIEQANNRTWAAQGVLSEMIDSAKAKQAEQKEE